ncbi:hypothetical protein [Nocardia sp. NPDC005978]|uniref:hypothetical protein n=1 Tax=unclassified Nocardia TaxID=2637762 RepID=UPI0033BBC3CE
MNPLPPLAYGYLRLDLLDASAIESHRRRLSTAARELGCELGTVFLEPHPRDETVPSAFLDLLHECRRAQARTVITLCGHLTGLPVPHDCLLGVLADRAAATVCEVNP